MLISSSLFDADESEETPTEEPLKIESGYAFSVLDDADASWEMMIRRIKAEVRRHGFTGIKSTIKGDPVRKKQGQQIAGMPTLVPVASLSNPDLVRVDNGILTQARTTLNRSQGKVADRAGLRCGAPLMGGREPRSCRRQGEHHGRRRQVFLDVTDMPCHPECSVQVWSVFLFAIVTRAL